MSDKKEVVNNISEEQKEENIERFNKIFDDVKDEIPNSTKDFIKAFTVSLGLMCCCEIEKDGLDTLHEIGIKYLDKLKEQLNCVYDLSLKELDKKEENNNG